MAAKIKTNQERLDAMTQANQERMEANQEKNGHQSKGDENPGGLPRFPDGCLPSHNAFPP
jgi:hypothetical protein